MRARDRAAWVLPPASWSTTPHVRCYSSGPTKSTKLESGRHGARRQHRLEDDMTQELISELQMALIPDNALADRHIALSKQMANYYPAVITLTGIGPRLAFTPHLTVYQVAIKTKNLDQMFGALAKLTSTVPFVLAATGYQSNADEGSFEVRYEAASRLMQFQDEV